jgi:hypothetical protein
MSDAGKALCQRAKEFASQQKQGEDEKTKAHTMKVYQEALVAIAKLVDEGSTIHYIELYPYNEFVARMLVADGFRRIETEDRDILFSWDNK